MSLAATATRYVYDFDEEAPGGREQLGGKGIGLSEMTRLGLPVPGGFTVTTDACRSYMELGAFPDGPSATSLTLRSSGSKRGREEASDRRTTRSSSPFARVRRSRCRG